MIRINKGCKMDNIMRYKLMSNAYTYEELKKYMNEIKEWLKINKSYSSSTPSLIFVSCSFFLWVIFIEWYNHDQIQSDIYDICVNPVLLGWFWKQF